MSLVVNAFPIATDQDLGPITCFGLLFQEFIPVWKQDAAPAPIYLHQVGGHELRPRRIALKRRSGRLKVFKAQFGFHDSVVAAPSQAAALRAWGTHQNLFAEGRAAVTEDTAAVEAAMANPNLPLRRALGSSGPFEVVSTTLPVIPDLPKGMGKGKAATGSRRSKPRPDRSRLDAAERALRDLDAEGKKMEADLEARLEALQAETERSRKAQQSRRSKAVAAVTAARQAYRNAGGDAD